MNETRAWNPDDLAASWASPPGLGRCVGIGSGIGVALAFVGIAVPSVLSGLEWESAVGFGAFVAFWGGLGFGSMMGGVAYVMGLEKAAAADAALEAPDAAEAGAPAEREGPPSTPERSDDRRVA